MEEVPTETNRSTRGCMLVDRACLPLPRRTAEPGGPRHPRPPERGAAASLQPSGLFILVPLRGGEPLTRLAGGFGAAVSTAWRYVYETVARPRLRGGGRPPHPAARWRPSARSPWADTVGTG
ncbi:hypothetical protein GCM10022630_39840 [Thermobifida alba]